MEKYSVALGMTRSHLRGDVMLLTVQEHTFYVGQSPNDKRPLFYFIVSSMLVRSVNFRLHPLLLRSSDV